MTSTTTTVLREPSSALADKFTGIRLLQQVEREECGSFVDSHEQTRYSESQSDSVHQYLALC